MNCEQARNLAALEASGDLTNAEQCDLDAHLADCPGCSAEAAGFALVLNQLSTLSSESPPDHVYAAVRARVAAELAGRRFRWPAFVAVLACSVMLVVLLRPAATVVNRPAQLAPAESLAVSAPIQTEPVAPAIRHRVARAKVKEPVDPLIVHMFTDDPDVVIYWIADGHGDRAKKEIIQ